SGIHRAERFDARRKSCRTARTLSVSLLLESDLRGCTVPAEWQDIRVAGNNNAPAPLRRYTRSGRQPGSAMRSEARGWYCAETNRGEQMKTVPFRAPKCVRTRKSESRSVAAVGPRRRAEFLW